ncbi:polymeric immunoglobulin receptor-like [Chiloscyllium punctatum]|uniref:polymeric immunoglobulin receptor-like n=1 Tax=Chiloscyllium punctatum TaxID=137246 RepID=UPI003B63F1C9
MWTLILLICSIPVSDALWAEEHVTGILGRAVTISCHYEAQQYQSHVKYWCQGWSRMCSVRAKTNWPNGRITITDDKTRGMFLVTIKNLQWEDAGWYSCGIEAFAFDSMFNVKLHISDEAVSVPGLRYLSEPIVSCFGGSVTVSCESARGSLPIHYTWSEKTPSQDLKISGTNKLDLHCQSFTQQHHQYYCTASNTQGTKSSEIVHVSVNNVREKNCSYRIQINSIGREYTCDKSSTKSRTRSTTKSPTTSTTKSPTTTTTISPTATGTSSGPKSVRKSYVVWDVIRWVLFTLLVICSVSVTMFTRKRSEGLTSRTELIFVNKTMWTLILLICSISVVSPASSNLWTNEKVTGTVGRSVTINCRYDTWFKSNMKYWCLGRSAHCSYLVRTTDPGGQRGRMSIKDNTAQGVFVVTMEDLRIKDAGWYSCGIDRQVIDELRAVKIEVSDEPVSVPVIRFLTPNIWCFENLVSVSCESVQGSFPIRYTWYERTQSVGSKISESNTLDLHCQLIKQQYHQYYCIASNTQGEKSSEMVEVAIVHRSERNCSFMAQIGSRGSGVVPAKNKITGVLGRAITIDCLYGKWSRWSVKLWMRQCSVLVKSSEHHGQRGRMSITDNTTQNKFSVTMEDLRSEDAGWYNCGIDQSGRISASAVELQISDEPVSVPELRFLSSPPNASCFGSSVSIFCESVQGSLPIHYTWCERTPSQDSKISNTSKLDLHCQFFKQQRHQYYCTASNTQGEKSSEMVNVSVTHRPGENCSYLAQISTSGKDGVGAGTDNAFENQQTVGAEENIVYSSIHSQSRSRQSEGTVHFKNTTNGVIYADLHFQKKSSARNGETSSYPANRGNALVQSQIPEDNVVSSTTENPPESEMAIYANVKC